MVQQQQRVFSRTAHNAVRACAQFMMVQKVFVQSYARMMTIAQASQLACMCRQMTLFVCQIICLIRYLSPQKRFYSAKEWLLKRYERRLHQISRFCEYYFRLERA